tara:strand:+ start:110 stop:469 length:360 start_codon:yes stop_codon:yes gene_type:complete
MEQISFVGFLDQMACPFFGGAIPTAVEQPCCLSLLIAASVRIALRPGDFGMSVGLPDDSKALLDLEMILESVQPRVSKHDFAVDMVLKSTCAIMVDTINKIRQTDSSHHRVSARMSSYA